MIVPPAPISVIQIVAATVGARLPSSTLVWQVAATSCPAAVLAEFPSARVILSVPPGANWGWIRELVRRKRYFALSAWHDESWPDLQQLAQYLIRRRPAPVLLGTWRYLPAMLGLREMLTAGILGQNVRLKLCLPATSMPQKQLLTSDAIAFLGGEALAKTALITESDDDLLQITAAGNVGTAVASGDMNGKGATLTIKQGDRERCRSLPAGNPKQLEMMAFVNAEPDECCLPKVTEMIMRG